VIKQINLYQAAFRPPSVVLPANKLLISGGVFIAGLLALYFWNGWQLRQLQQQVTQVVQRAAAVSSQVQASAPGARQADPGVAIEAATLEARINSLQLAQEAIASGELGSETGYAAQFQALARAVGDSATGGAWLTGATLYDSGRAMDLRGRALSGDAAARLIGNLRREPLFVGMSFAGLQVGPPAQDAEANETNQATAKPAKPPYLVFSLDARPAELAATNQALAGQITPATGKTP
jgi:hypothetical protein